jgi:hypothetical protein
MIYDMREGWRVPEQDTGEAEVHTTERRQRHRLPGAECVDYAADGGGENHLQRADGAVGEHGGAHAEGGGGGQARHEHEQACGKHLFGGEGETVSG